MARHPHQCKRELCAFHYAVRWRLLKLVVSAYPDPTHATNNTITSSSVIARVISMSYLIQFPSLPLPIDIRSPPYVVFGLNGQDIVAHLPQRIPLKTVLHFAPKFREWILPPPTRPYLPRRPLRRLELRSSFIGIDIRSYEIELLGLKWILLRMLQASGATHPSLYLMQPTIFTSIAIHKTWLALELPLAGIQCLSTHIVNSMSFGLAVSLVEMKALWAAFSSNSDIMTAMGENLVRSYLNSEFTHAEFRTIRTWYIKSLERRSLFRELEAQYPMFQEMVRQASVVLVRRPLLKEKEADTAEKSVKKVLERNGTRKVSTEERNKLHKKDEAALQTRLKRTKSDASVRSVETVIWNPLDPQEKTGTETDAEEEAREIDEELLTVTRPLSRVKVTPRCVQRKPFKTPGLEHPRPLPRSQDSSHPNDTKSLIDSPVQEPTQSNIEDAPQSSKGGTRSGDTAWVRSLAVRIKLSVQELRAIKKKAVEGSEDEILATEANRDGHDKSPRLDKDNVSRNKLDCMEFD